MKRWQLVLAVLLVGVSVFPLSCARSSTAVAPQNQIATVQRGDLTIDITATGNLASSNKTDLAFGMAGTVAEVLVKAGDSVKEGQVLAKLDTSDWETQVTNLERQLLTAQRNLRAKEKLVTAAERQVTATELSLRLAQINAQINLRTAQNNLSAIADVKTAQDAVDALQNQLNIIEANLLVASSSSADWYFWANQKTLVQKQLADAQKELTKILAGSSTKVTTDVALDVAAKQLQVEQAQRAVEDAQIAIDDYDAKTAIEDAKLDVDYAQVDVKNAQKALDDAKNTGPEVKAPFDRALRLFASNGAGRAHSAARE